MVAALPIVATGSVVYGTAGNDILDLRNAVNTTAYGYSNPYGDGNDTYLFGKGAGQDTITDYDTTAGNVDTIRLTGLLASDVTLVRELNASGNSSNLLIKINGTTDTLRVQNFYSSSYYQIEKVVLDDGTTWNSADLNSLAIIATGATAYGTAGNDTIDLRNAVNTNAYGYSNPYGDGNDTYLFGKGAGQDTITDYDTMAGNVDTIRVTGLLASEVTLVRELNASGTSSNLLIKINGTTDTLRVQNFYSASAYQIEKVVLDDGTSWNSADLNSLAIIATGATANGTAGNDTIDLRNAVNTNAYGYSNPYGDGNDTYLFGKGSGKDTITDYDTTLNNTDQAQFGPDISAEQLWFRHVGNNLEVSVIGTADTLTVQNWYAGAAYHVEQFKTSNGKTLLDSQVQNLVSAMAGFAPPAAGQTTLTTDYATALTPVIAANWQ